MPCLIAVLAHPEGDPVEHLLRRVSFLPLTTRKYFSATMLTVVSFHHSGTSTPFCRNFSLPCPLMMTASRVTHFTVSKG
jgi:hypothetical protein